MERKKNKKQEELKQREQIKGKKKRLDNKRNYRKRGRSN